MLDKIGCLEEGGADGDGISPELVHQGQISWPSERHRDDVALRVDETVELHEERRLALGEGRVHLKLEHDDFITVQCLPILYILYHTRPSLYATCTIMLPSEYPYRTT